MQPNQFVALNRDSTPETHLNSISLLKVVGDPQWKHRYRLLAVGRLTSDAIVDGMRFSFC
jgi:hypothetical protein